MNRKQTRPTPGFPVVPITQHSYWPCCRSAPQGVVRPVVGPHSPFFAGSRVSLPLRYMLKVFEPGSCRVVSETRMAGPEEASAALKLLGPTKFQPVLVGGATAEFLRRAS